MNRWAARKKWWVGKERERKTLQHVTPWQWKEEGVGRKEGRKESHISATQGALWHTHDKTNNLRTPICTYIQTNRQSHTSPTHIIPSTHHTHASHVFGIVNVYANKGIHPDLFITRYKRNRDTGVCPRRSVGFAIRWHYHMYSSTSLRVYTRQGIRNTQYSLYL